MASPKMVKMGIKRKEMYPEETATPMTKKAADKEEMRPSMRLDGAHAEMMGAEDLKKGDRIRQTCEWVVTEHVKREENGKPPHFAMTLELDKGSDMQDCGDGESEDADDEGDESGDSPAMAYIQGRAKED